MKKYSIVIEQTETGFSGYSPDLPRCVSTGQDREDIETNMQEAIALHLDGMREEEQANSCMDEVTMLYRPVGPKELKLIEASDYREFPPRLPEQPIFYPVFNEGYAAAIAKDWNAGNPSIGSGFVTRFAVKSSYLSKFAVQKVGSAIHQEYWIPAEELKEFNANIVGKIEVIREFHGK